MPPRLRCVAVPAFTITIVNEEFSARDEHSCPDQEAARRHAIGAALAIGSEQIAAGKPFFGAHVTLSGEGEESVQFVVSAGASPLKG